MKSPKVLAIIEPNTDQQPALEEAIKLAPTLNAEVIALLCVYDLAAELDSLITGTIIKNLRMPIIEKAEKWLKECLNQCEIPTGCTVTPRVSWSKSNQKMIDHIDKEDNICLVVSTQNEASNWVANLLHGHDWQLIHQNPADLLLLDKNLLLNKNARFQNQNAVIALDTHSPEHKTLNNKIITKAKCMADQYGLTLTLVHSYPKLEGAAVMGIEPTSELLEEAQQGVAKAHKETALQFASQHGLNENQVQIVERENHSKFEDINSMFSRQKKKGIY